MQHGELLAAIRGDAGLPRITPRLQRRAAARLGGTDRAILAMRLARTPDREIAATVGMPRAALAGRVAAILNQLDSVITDTRESSGAARSSGGIVNRINPASSQ